MGSLFSIFQRHRDREVDEAIDKLRRDIITRKFRSQRILLFGQLGVGKSSLINTFNMTINLVDPRSSERGFEDIAEVAEDVPSSKTKNLTFYGIEKNMYAALETSDELRDFRLQAPVFFDLPGFPNRESAVCKEVIKGLIRGEIPENCDVDQLIHGDVNTVANILCVAESVQRRPWAVVLVINGEDPLADPPVKLISLVKSVVDDEGRGRWLNLRIFAIVTHANIRESHYRTFVRRIARTIGSHENHVYCVNNYLPIHGNTPDGKLLRQKTIDHAVLKAFSSILDETNKPSYY